MTREAFAANLQRLTAFYRQSLSTAQMDEWWRALKGYRAETLELVVDTHIATSKYNTMPAPGVITEMLGQYRKESVPPRATREIYEDNEELDLTMQIINEIVLWCRIGLVEFVAPETDVSTIDEWVAAGRPKLWCTIMDNWFAQWERVIDKGKDDRVAWLRQYRDRLVSARAKKVAQKG